MNQMNENQDSPLFLVLKNEMSDSKIKQKHISKHINRQSTSGHLWKMIRKNSVKLSVLVKICDFLGLEIIIRNPAKNCEYLLNPKKK